MAIRDAVLRRTADGHVLGRGERLPAGAALALYTQGAAFAIRREDEVGSLESGMLADFVVLDTSPTDTDPPRIGDIQVLATVISGTAVHQSGDIFPG